MGGRHIQQQAPGHHLREGVDAEPVRAVVLDDVGKQEPAPDQPDRFEDLTG